MLQSSQIASAALALIAVCITAGCASNAFQPLEGVVPASFSKDVKGGYFDNVIRGIPCNANALSATVHMSAVNEDPHWDTQMTISFSNKEHPLSVVQSDDRVVILSVQKLRGGQLTAGLFTKYVGTKRTDNARFSAPLALDTDIPVAADWTPQGTIRATIGKEQLTLALDEPVKSLKFSISGAKGEFRDIKAGYLGKPPSDCGTHVPAGGTPKPKAPS